MSKDKLFNFPIKTFSPENLLKEMLAAKDGDVFVLGEDLQINPEGRDMVVVTMVQIKKVVEQS